MEDAKQYPSLPSNYVTLVQLQERWNKEQQQKQTEEEKRLEEQQKKQRQKEENEDSTETNSKPTDRRPFRRHDRNPPEKDRWPIKASYPKPEESAVAVIGKETFDQDRELDESKKMKKKKKKKKEKKRRKPKTEEDLTRGTAQSPPEKEQEEVKLTGGTAQTPPEKEEEEKRIPVVVAGRNREKKKIRREFRWKNKNLVVDGKVSEQEAPADQVAYIGLKFEDLSMNSGKEECSYRSPAAMNGGTRNYKGYGRFDRREVWNPRESAMNGGRQYYKGYGRFDRREVWNPRESGLVWVRKGDVSDGNAAGIRSSGGSRQRD